MVSIVLFRSPVCFEAVLYTVTVVGTGSMAMIENRLLCKTCPLVPRLGRQVNLTCTVVGW